MHSSQLNSIAIRQVFLSEQTGYFPDNSRNRFTVDNSRSGNYGCGFCSAYQRATVLKASMKVTNKPRVAVVWINREIVQVYCSGSCSLNSLDEGGLP